MTSPKRPSPQGVEALAAAPLDDGDVRALDAVADLYSTLDPVPAGLVERIRFGITLDALHAEIAELQRDSDLAGVRTDDATTVQTVTFTTARLSVVVTVTPLSAERARVDGWIAGEPGAGVELRSVAGVLTELSDEDGRFVFEDAPRGLAQFTVRPASAPPVVTPSIEI